MCMCVSACVGLCGSSCACVCRSSKFIDIGPVLTMESKIATTV